MEKVGGTLHIAIGASYEDCFVGNPASEAGQARVKELEQLGVAAFGEIEIVKNFESGALAVAQANGIAGIESNTVMFGWSRKPDRRAAHLRVIEALSTLGTSSVICKSDELDLRPKRRREPRPGSRNVTDKTTLTPHRKAMR